MKAINKISGPSARTSKDEPIENTNLVLVYNPDNEDFTTTYDINENGKPVKYTIKSRQIGKFPAIVATHIKKHLATAILNKRDVAQGSNWADDHKKIIDEELTVNL